MSDIYTDKYVTVVSSVGEDGSIQFPVAVYGPMPWAEAWDLRTAMLPEAEAKALDVALPIVLEEPPFSHGATRVLIRARAR